LNCFRTSESPYHIATSPSLLLFHEYALRYSPGLMPLSQHEYPLEKPSERRQNPAFRSPNTEMRSESNSREGKAVSTISSCHSLCCHFTIAHSLWLSLDCPALSVGMRVPMCDGPKVSRNREGTRGPLIGEVHAPTPRADDMLCMDCV
jgi:hypothetical protein